MVSVIILTYNSEKFIESCITSFVDDAMRSNIKYEIFVVDNGSSDNTIFILNKLKKNMPELNIIKFNRNLGTTFTRNIAIKRSRGRYILILDSDTKVKPGTLRELCGVLEKSPRAGIVAPKLLNADGSVQKSAKRFPTVLLKLCKVIPINCLNRLGIYLELYPNNYYDCNFQNIKKVDYCIAACWLIRREAINYVGLLDEKIYYSPEDVDYCLRMWLKGWQVLYVTTAEVYHYEQRRSYREVFFAFVHIKGLIYYFRKYGYWFNRKSVYKHLKKSI